MRLRLADGRNVVGHPDLGDCAYAGQIAGSADAHVPCDGRHATWACHRIVGDTIKKSRKKNSARANKLRKIWLTAAGFDVGALFFVIAAGWHWSEWSPLGVAVGMFVSGVLGSLLGRSIASDSPKIGRSSGRSEPLDYGGPIIGGLDLHNPIDFSSHQSFGGSDSCGPDAGSDCSSGHY